MKRWGKGWAVRGRGLGLGRCVSWAFIPSRPKVCWKSGTDRPGTQSPAVDGGACWGH